jgi:hypothetical protein
MNLMVSTRLPAFGKEVRRALDEGLMPPRALYVVRAWPKTPPLWTVVVPRNEDPRDYDLSLVRGLSVWVKLLRGARGNEVLIEMIEAVGPEGGVITVEGVAGCTFLNGTLARARIANE